MIKLAAALAISAIASIAHSQQQFDYAGNEMFGDAVGNITAQFQITGNTVNYDLEVFGENKLDEIFSDTFVGVYCLAAQHCTPSQFGQPPFLFQFGLHNNAPPSFSVADAFAPNALLLASVGPRGDAFSIIEGGITDLRVSNNTPGSWTLNGAPIVAAPELSTNQLTVAITLLVGGLLVFRSRRREPLVDGRT